MIGGTYDVGGRDLFDDIRFVIFRVDGAVVGDCVDFLSFGANFGDGVGGVFLKLLDNAVHDIDEDDLSCGISERSERQLMETYFIAGQM